VIQGDEAAFELLVAHEQLAKPIEPAVADLDHPPSGLLGRIAPLDVGLLASIDDVRNVAVRFDDANVVGAAVAGISAQVLVAPHRRALALDHDRAEDLVDSLAVIDVGCGHDE